MTDLLIEHAETRCGCQMSRDSRGELQALYYPESPDGDGWVLVRHLGEYARWRRVRLAGGLR